MTLSSYDRYCAEIVAQTDLLRCCIEGADLTVTVPSCPGWNVGQLLRHASAVPNAGPRRPYGPGRRSRSPTNISATCPLIRRDVMAGVRVGEGVPWSVIPDSMVKYAPAIRLGTASTEAIRCRPPWCGRW
ncbi:MAG: hypothetical protein ACRDRO_17655 [Pseudonocardiaceae bacterium]